MEIEESCSTFQVLLAVTLLLLTYLFVEWFKNPIRRIPGPPGLPILGNALSLDPTNIHNQFYEMSKEYGSVMKVYIFNQPIVVLNTTEVCLEALITKGTDFHGRPPTPRMKMLFPKDVVFSSIDDGIHQPLRRMFTKAMKAYGPGIKHLEDIMQEIVFDLTDELQAKEGEAFDVHELCYGYVCCVLASMLFGEKYSYNDPICQTFRQINSDVIYTTDPISLGAIFDMFPALLHFKFVLSSYQKYLRDTLNQCREFFQQRIDDAKENYNKYEIKGCVDYMIQTQQQEFDENGKPIIDDEALRGVLADMLVAGSETSLSALSQMFLDLLHNPDVMKRIQAQIDQNFEPAHTITFNDREKLPLLDAFMYESQRCLPVAPLMIPHMTIRDTGVAGFKIPKQTRVVMNTFCTSYNPDVYENPFTFKLERFLDEEEKLVPADHPARSNLLSFGAGRRQCPGEVLARSRMFLLCANLLQKFNIEPAGKLPDHDPRKYKLRIILLPPDFKIKFTRRQQ